MWIEDNINGARGILMREKQENKTKYFCAIKKWRKNEGYKNSRYLYD